MMKGTKIALVPAFLIVAMFETRPLNAQDARQRFEKEARNAWREYIGLATHVQGTAVHERIDRAHGPKLLGRGRGDIKVSNRSAIVTSESFKDDEPATVEGCNEKYVFNLQRARRGDPWVLTSITFDPELVSGESAQRPDLTARRFTCAGLRTSTGWLPEMVDEPGFSVDHAESRNVAGETLVDVTFRFVHSGHGDDYAEEGHMLLDPSRYWLLRETDVKVREPPEAVGGVQAVHMEYKDSDGLPVPKRRVMHIDFQASEPVAGRGGLEEVHDDLVWEYDFHRVTDASERDFTLSAYDIPEPIRPTAVRSPARTRLFFVIVIGAVLLAVGLLLRRRLSRVELNPGR